MGLTVMLLAGVGIGVGLLAVVVSLRRPYPALAPTLARINRPASFADDDGPAERNVVLHDQ